MHLIITGGTLYRVTPDASCAKKNGRGGDDYLPDALPHTIMAPKMALTNKSWGVAFGYTPWLTEVTKEMNISNLNGYYSWAPGNGIRHAITGLFKHFNMGNATIF